MTSHLDVREMKIKYHYFVIATLALLITSANWGHGGEPAASESMLDELERSLELGRHERLLVEKQNPAYSLSAFTTDGCSGGLSVGWQHLSEKIELLKTVHGDLPPWESCCISHDRLYHSAGDRNISAEMSFVARRKADQDLRSCVLEVGLSRAPQLSEQYELSLEEVGQAYQVIGDLMYRAVRIGGVPCSGLPWRWGYGWPECD
ncbi:MAG: hypothetical protein ACR2PB_05880 [Desulfocapsaceae bacterium]